MSELTWDWETIATALMWKCAPKGVVITRKDLSSLPPDRVLVDYRDPQGTHIKLSFPTVAEAIKLRDAGASLSELQGRWQKMATVALWKLKRTVPVILRTSDLAPADRLLLLEGFKQDVLVHFVNRHQARKMLDQDVILEKIPT